jgi:hypothetical protein
VEPSRYWCQAATAGNVAATVSANVSANVSAVATDAAAPLVARHQPSSLNVWLF